MLALSGIYKDGYVKLDTEYPVKAPMKVIVTFLEEAEPSAEKPLTFSDFSFAESRKAPEGYNGSLSDEVIRERRGSL